MTGRSTITLFRKNEIFENKLESKYFNWQLQELLYFYIDGKEYIFSLCDPLTRIQKDLFVCHNFQTNGAVKFNNVIIDYLIMALLHR